MIIFVLINESRLIRLRLYTLVVVVSFGVNIVVSSKGLLQPCHYDLSDDCTSNFHIHLR